MDLVPVQDTGRSGIFREYAVYGLSKRRGEERRKERKREEKSRKEEEEKRCDMVSCLKDV